MNRSCCVAIGAAIAGVLVMAAPARAQGQPQRGGQGQAIQAPADAKVLARVRVPTSHANIHSGPSTGNELLVVAPKGTEMAMVGRRGEWIQVQLPQTLRKTGILMRWYKNETSGWMHDSTVEFLTPEAKPDAK
ncbi:MAG: SH3 domain-containing protein [Vicinamibacterales bacterium]